MSEELMKASRQYRHNNSDDFVHGYDKEVIDKYVDALQAKLNKAEENARYFDDESADRLTKIIELQARITELEAHVTILQATNAQLETADSKLHFGKALPKEK